MTSEALTLSASLFHADIDSWLPADFGVAKPRSTEWEITTRGERLGVGHPSLADPTSRAQAASQRAGIEVLNRKLKKRKEEAAAFVPAEEEEDEGESRGGKASAKKKRRVDPFKKGEAKVHPLLDLRNPIPGYDAPREVAPAKPEPPAKVDPPAAPTQLPDSKPDLSKTQLRHLKRKQQKAKQKALKLKAN